MCKRGLTPIALYAEEGDGDCGKYDAEYLVRSQFFIESKPAYYGSDGLVNIVGNVA